MFFVQLFKCPYISSCNSIRKRIAELDTAKIWNCTRGVAKKLLVLMLRRVLLSRFTTGCPRFRLSAVTSNLLIPKNRYLMRTVITTFDSSIFNVLPLNQIYYLLLGFTGCCLKAIVWSSVNWFSGLVALMRIP